MHPREVERSSHRIVLVSGGIKLGGATTFLLNLGGELVRREIPVQVVSLEHENPYASDFELARIPLHVEDERKAIFEDRLASALQVIRGFKPTVVIACLGPSSYEILRYVPESVTRLGVVQSDYPEVYGPIVPYARFFDATIGVSQQIAANLRDHPLLGRVPSFYLPYGVPVPGHSVRRVLGPVEPIRILYLGRVCREQKRVHLFPEILRQLRNADLPFQWTIAGDGSERGWLEARMTSAPNSRIHFTGPINYRDVPRIFDSHDVFLLASHAEGLPLSLLESMGHGLVPVVSNLRSGVSDVVDQDCGILVDPDNVDGYAAGIVWLARNREAFAVMAEKAARKVRANYSVAAMADRWLTLLTQLRKKSGTWPETFSVTGPLGGDFVRFVRPMRALRRFVRRWLAHSLRKQPQS